MAGKKDDDIAPKTGDAGSASKNDAQLEQARQERAQQEQTADGLKLVIAGATIKCDLCTKPTGILLVNFDTPTTQEKLTATIEEKDATSLVFSGNCIKSPNSAAPCASVMKLGNWKATGSLLVQDRAPLLQKSTIPCLYGGLDISIVDSGQVNEPDEVKTDGVPIPDEEPINGYFYNYNGTYEGHVTGKKKGSENDVYACDGKGEKKDIYLKIKKLSTQHEHFILDSSTTYGESSAAYNVIDKLEFFAIASVHKRNKKAYGANSDFAKKFRSLKDSERNKNEAMKHSIAAEINVLRSGHDYSNGASQWDGAEQTHLPKDSDTSSNGRFMFKVNVMGWDIEDEHYVSWQAAIKDKFGDKFFNAPQKKYAVSNYGGMKNKDKIRLQSTAQYALTIFWKEVNITKPEEK